MLFLLAGLVLAVLGVIIIRQHRRLVAGVAMTVYGVYQVASGQGLRRRRRDNPWARPAPAQ